MEGQGKRFRELRKNLSFNQVQMADYLDITQAFVTKTENSHKPIPPNVISKLVEKNNTNGINLNLNWLLKGEGKMYLEIDTEQGGVVGVPNVTIVPFIVNAGAGIASQMVEVVSRASIPFVRSGAYAFHLKGNSMQPVFENDDWLLAYEIKNNEDVKTGKVYIIKTTDGTLLCKYIDKRGAKWILRSENYHNHANIEVPIEEISTVYDIEKRITGVFGWE